MAKTTNQGAIQLVHLLLAEIEHLDRAARGISARAEVLGAKLSEIIRDGHLDDAIWGLPDGHQSAPEEVPHG